MDMETIRLVIVGAFTLLAGALGSGITASVAARNSKAERMEDRFTWKREKLVDLVTELLDISRENQDIFRQPLDLNRIREQGARLVRASELVILWDSGIVARAGTHMIQSELERLSAHSNAPRDQPLSEARKQELDAKCVEGRAALVAATRITLGDPTQSRFMRRYGEKVVKKINKGKRSNG